MHLSILSLHAYTGVYLSLNGTNYTSNSVILITEIGQTDYYSIENSALQCITDRRPCCATPYRYGEWYFPNYVRVQSYWLQWPWYAVSFYQTRGNDGTVNLNRFNDSVMMPTGRFCCVVPDATGVTQTLCAYIGNTII